MTLDQIRYFLTTAETQHIGRASGILNVSPSAISHSLRKLEEDLGKDLFEKSGKRIFLSEFGRQFMPRAQELLDQATLLRSDFRGQDLPLRGLLRIGATHGLSNRVLPEIVQKVQRLHPELRFELYSLRSAEVVRLIAEGQLDVGLCFGPQEQPAIVVQQTHIHELKVCVRRQHPILKQKSSTWPKKLSELPSASPKAFSGIQICEEHPSLLKKNITPNVAMIFDSYEVAAGYLRSSNAWCLIPEMLVEEMQLAAVPVPGLRIDSVLAVITPKGRPLPPILAEEFSKKITEMMKAQA